MARQASSGLSRLCKETLQDCLYNPSQGRIYLGDNTDTPGNAQKLLQIDRLSRGPVSPVGTFFMCDYAVNEPSVDGRCRRPAVAWI